MADVKWVCITDPAGVCTLASRYSEKWATSAADHSAHDASAGRGRELPDRPPPFGAGGGPATRGGVVLESEPGPLKSIIPTYLGGRIGATGRKCLT